VLRVDPCPFALSPFPVFAFSIAGTFRLSPR
jgi:hypothetical protein